MISEETAARVSQVKPGMRDRPWIDRHKVRAVQETAATGSRFENEDRVRARGVC